MKRLVLATAPALAIIGLSSYAALTAQAPTEAPGKRDPARVMAGSYTIDGAHTLVAWRVSHFGVNDYIGLFGDAAGTLQLDPRNLGASKLALTIPVSRVTVASEGLREHLMRPGKDGGKPDFFGAAPADARFVSTAVRRTGPMTATITGDLTLNGVTRPVTIAAEFTGAGANPMNKRLNIGFHGKTEIQRSQFGIGYGIPMVADRVELDITAAFERAEPAAAAEPQDACRSAAAADTIGRKDTTALRAEVARKVGHTMIRWLPPGSIVTQDRRIERLNVDLDAGGVVTRLRCG